MDYLFDHYILIGTIMAPVLVIIWRRCWINGCMSGRADFTAEVQRPGCGDVQLNGYPTADAAEAAGIKYAGR